MKGKNGNNIITCVKLIKYGMNVKQCLGAMILFITIGIAFEVVTVLGKGTFIWNGNFDFGALFLYSAAMYPAQILMSLELSGMVQASPYKRTIQTGAMSFASLCGNFTALAIVLAVRGTAACVMPESSPAIWATLPAVGILGLGLSIMAALMYKFYIISLIVLAVVFGIYGGFMGAQGSMGMVQESAVGGMSLPVAVLFCVVMILLGNSIQFLTARALYKLPFSRRAFGNAVGKKFV